MADPLALTPTLTLTPNPNPNPNQASETPSAPPVVNTPPAAVAPLPEVVSAIMAAPEVVAA